MKFLNKLFGRNAVVEKPSLMPSVKAVDDEDDLQEVPRYPPFVRGFKLYSPDRLIETQEELIHRICGTCGLSHEDDARYIMPLIRNLVEFVHLLPASQSHHHRAMGGLFRHSLEVGLYSAISASGRIFAYGKTPTQRQMEEPAWLLGALVAGLLHDTGKPVMDMSVTNQDGDKEWPVMMKSLWQWGTEDEVDRYFIRWKSGRHGNHIPVSAGMVNRLMPPELTQRILKGNEQIITAIYAAIEGRDDYPLTQFVKSADSYSTGEDLRNNRADGMMDQTGVPVEKIIIRTIRRMLVERRWVANENGSRVWVTNEGVFIVWKNAVAEIMELLRADSVSGIPGDKDILAEMLVDRDYAIPDEGHTFQSPKFYWHVSPEQLIGRQGGAIWLECLKIPSAEMIFDNIPPMPVKAMVRSSSEQRKVMEDERLGVGKKSTAALVPKVSKEKNTKEEISDKARQQGLSMPDKADDSKPNGGPVPPAKAEKPRRKAKESRPSTGTLEGVIANEEKQDQAPNSDDKQKVEKSPDTKPEDTKVHNSVQQPASQVDALTTFLSKSDSEAAAVMLKLAEQIKQKTLIWDETFRVCDGKVYMPFPGHLDRFMKPIALANQLMDAGWVTSDPANPLKKVSDFSNGEKGLLLCGALEQQISSWIEPAAEEACNQPDSREQSTDNSASGRDSGTYEAEKQPSEAEQARPDYTGEKKSRPSAVRSQPKKLAPAVDGRPPVKEVVQDDKVAGLVNKFYEQVVAGKVPSTEGTYEGRPCLQVSPHEAIKFSKGKVKSSALFAEIKRNKRFVKDTLVINVFTSEP